MYDISDAPKLVAWEDLKKKGYHVIPVPENYKPTPALRWFSESRECDTPDPLNPKRGTEKAKELGTYSGKLEFVSQSLYPAIFRAGKDMLRSWQRNILCR